MAQFKIGTSRSHNKQGAFAQSCSYGGDHFAYTLAAIGEDKSVQIRLSASEVQRVLNFLEEHAALIERAAKAEKSAQGEKS